MNPSRRIHLLLLGLFTFLCLSQCQYNDTSAIPNTLTQAEIENGWLLLWDGQSFDGWRAIYEQDFPKSGWVIENDALVCLGTELPDSLRGGAIITEKMYGSFELTFEFKIKAGANSGVKYFVDERLKASSGHGLGLEYAILDDERWPYDRADYNRTCGSLYDLVRAPEDKPVRPLGEWNSGRIVVRGNHLEHWLNGQKVVEIEKGSDDYRQRVANSKYHNIKGWGEFPQGHILLQDEGPRAEFRNLKIREL